MALIDEVINEVRQGFQDINSKLESLESRFTNFGARLGNVESKLANLDVRLGRLEEQTKTNCSKLDEMQKSLDALKKTRG